MQIGQFILGKNLGIGAFGKVRSDRNIGSKKTFIMVNGDTSLITADATCTLRNCMAIFLSMTSRCDLTALGTFFGMPPWRSFHAIPSLFVVRIAPKDFHLTLMYRGALQ